MIKNQKGFSSVEVLLALILIAILAFIGVYLAKNHKGSNPSTTMSTKASKSTPANKTIAAAGLKAASIATGLLNNSLSQGNNGVVSYVNNHVSDGDFTISFKTAVDNRTALPNGDMSPVACTNGIYPDNFGVGTASLSGNTALVRLTLIKSGADVTNQYNQVPQVTLSYINNNWSIDNYSCITNPSAVDNTGSTLP